MSRTVERKARRDHICGICGGVIAKGSRYMETTFLPGRDMGDLVIDNKPTSVRTHADRHGIRLTVKQETP